MAKAKANELKTRWTNSVVDKVNPLLYGRSLGPVSALPGVGTIDLDGTTYLDLRAYPFAERFMDAAIDRVDFSSCKFDAVPGFAQVTANRCRFVDAKIDGSISGTFADCNFDRCSLVGLIGWPDTRFIRCTFIEANFRGGNLVGSVFEECSFRACKMPRTEFLKCRFSGCDFTEAVFKDGSLGFCVLSRVRNNFKFVDPSNVQIKHEFIADRSLPTVDLIETSTVGTVFLANED